MLKRMSQVLARSGIDDLLIRNMRTAHVLALQGIESVIREDIRGRQLAFFEEYEKMCYSTRGVVCADAQLEFGDFNGERPEDF